LHHFRDITTLAVYVTACELEQAIFQKMFEIKATCTFQFMCKHTVDSTYHISWGMGVWKVSNNKSDLKSHSRSLV